MTGFKIYASLIILLVHLPSGDGVICTSTCTVACCTAAFAGGLAVLGFGPAGPVAGSFAAAWMSSLGIVAGGSLYSILQSIAMGGTGVVAGCGQICALMCVGS
ncbi:unnamed protein product [Owenia fusiformis]|uniref:Uncharacterized protein n=1 Tax=Owenia fusiformis TaxID=6347 RepID=A0A8J1TD26_OWEFU|nr:unnamed protein product [Owenia fusiformis]